MRTIRQIFGIAAGLLAVSVACQKATFPPAPASITVIHAMANGNAIVPQFGSDTTGRYYIGPTGGSTMVQVGYGASQLYSRVAGTNPLLVVPITDTAFKIFKGSMTLQSGGIYSFFLSGDTAHADTMLIQDNIPYYADSSTGVRFINLATGGKSLIVSLTGDPSHVPITTLSYRQISGFIKYAATIAAGGSYSFDVRDQATGDSLTTYTWSYPRFRSNTIVIAGSTDPSSTTPLNVFSVANY